MDRIGRYKIVRELGRGAMGIVYHAIDPNIGRPVAIKTIQIGGNRKPEDQDRLRERLFREARSAGLLSHPGIVTVYDVEQQGDLAYIAMEYVDGPTLDEVMSGDKPLPADRMFSILGQTAAALDYAHQKGIVHRDIKPANIMIAADGTAKIADFGIAKITESEQFTMTGSIVGTPHYMSPEQVQGQAVDGRSDQFSLAVIAYEMLTGEKPYTGEHLTTVVYKIVAEEPVAPHRINASLSGPIDNVLRKGLAKRPDGRYRTCTEFIGSLEDACATSKGWRPLARGAGLVEPTHAEGAAVPIPKVAGKTTVPALPPARRPQRSGGATTVERSEKKKSGFLPFLLAILMAAALLALIGWQAAPWLVSPSKSSVSNAATQDGDAPPAQPPQRATSPGDKASPMPPAPQVATDKPPASASDGTKPMQTQPEQGSDAKPAETKPVAADPAAKAAAEKTNSAAEKTNSGAAEKTNSTGPEKTNATVEKTNSVAPPKRPPARPSGPTPQQIRIISSPNGATAYLDGHADDFCTTPCALTAAPGHHTLAIRKDGYQLEHRELEVSGGEDPEELPAIILRPFAGTLLLSSQPPGASIRINGKLAPETTPAQLSLAPGNYSITIEKDGLKSTQSVEMKNGDLRRLRVTLGQ